MCLSANAVTSAVVTVASRSQNLRWSLGAKNEVKSFCGRLNINWQTIVLLLLLLLLQSKFHLKLKLYATFYKVQRH